VVKQSQLRLIYAIGIVSLFLIPSITIAADECDDSYQHIDENTSNHTQGLFLIYAGGPSTLMGCSAGVHLTAIWVQTSTGWVSYGFEGPTVILINGIPTFYPDAVRLYMEGFKGLAPGSFQWGVKSLIGARIRLIGICSYYELH
jgi:hypothetical protein